MNLKPVCSYVLLSSVAVQHLLKIRYVQNVTTFALNNRVKRGIGQMHFNWMALSEELEVLSIRMWPCSMLLFWKIRFIELVCSFPSTNAWFHSRLFLSKSLVWAVLLKT